MAMWFVQSLLYVGLFHPVEECSDICFLLASYPFNKGTFLDDMTDSRPHMRQGRHYESLPLIFPVTAQS